MEYKCIQAYSDHGLFETQDKSVQKNVARLLHNHENVKAYKLDPCWYRILIKVFIHVH